MSLSILGMFLLALFVFVGVRLALYKWLKPGAELSALPDETTPQQEVAEASGGSIWPVVTLLCIVVTLIVSLMMFGRVIAGG